MGIDSLDDFLKFNVYTTIFYLVAFYTKNLRMKRKTFIKTVSGAALMMTMGSFKNFRDESWKNKT